MILVTLEKHTENKNYVPYLRERNTNILTNFFPSHEPISAHIRIVISKPDMLLVLK